MNKIVLYLLLNIAFSSSGSILFGEIDDVNQTIDIMYESSNDILGLQFEISGIDINTFSGGAVEEYSFDIFNQGATILSFGASDHIPSGSGLLTKIHYNSFSHNNCILYAKIVTNEGQLVCGECSDINNQENFCDDIDFIPNFCNTSECFNSYSREIHPGVNLISFWELPSNKSLSSVFSTCGSIYGIIGEGVASSLINGESWVGSLDEIDCSSGYWVISEDECQISFQGEPCSNQYDLLEGSNLISYPFTSSMGIGTSIPGYVEEYFNSVIGEGVAATQITLYQWVGSLNEFTGGDGYWVKLSQPVSFSFTHPDSTILLNSSINKQD